MPVVQDDPRERVHRDRGLLLALVAVFPFGVLVWVQLFFSVQWSISSAWKLAVGAPASVTAIAPALAAPSVAEDRAATQTVVATRRMGKAACDPSIAFATR